jgi:hypothetical protein
MRKFITTAVVIGSLALAGSGLVNAQAPGASGANTAAASKRPSQCFQSNDWRGWRAADEKTVYFNVNLHEIYKVQMANACPELLDPTAHLVNIVRGSSMICSPVDLDLKVADDMGFSTPCIVDKITPMTPAEAAAIPKKFRPD